MCADVCGRVSYMVRNFKDRKTGLKIGRNICHNECFPPFPLINKAKNGSSEVNNAGTAGQADATVHHGKSPPVSA